MIHFIEESFPLGLQHSADTRINCENDLRYYPSGTPRKIGYL